MRKACSTCAAPFPDEERLVCHECGTVREAPSSLREERDALDEMHRALAAAMHAAKARSEDTNPARDRFLQNGFVPSHGDVLVEEAVRCQQLFREEVGADTAGPRARYRTCLLRLELLNADNPHWKAKVALLRQNLEVERVRSRREDLVIAAWIVGFLGVIGAGGYVVVRAISGMWMR